MQIDTDELQTFVTLIETGSFSRTGEQLGLTQPAVSKRIAQLEDKLGVPLIERFARHLRLTEAGHRFHERAQRILREVENAVTEASRASDRVSGTLRLACSHHIGLHHLPAAIRLFNRRYPDVDFECRFVGSEETERFVLSGEVELGLATLPTQPPEHCTCEALWQDTMIFVVGREHPLARQPQLKLSDLSGYPALLPEPYTETFRQVEQLFRAHQLSLQPAIPTNYLETLKMMVSVGLGWSVLPLSMLDDTLCRLQPGEHALQRTLGVITDARRLLSRRAESFMACLREPPYTPHADLVTLKTPD